ncbi:MAG: AMP-binding protein [Desulfovibrio sp.]|jgi:phenylacetate-coenzyme A ligase PaaK-like adenylate-forming protein|nr:AMP-binding protein [Desulfovibrio sp.]
MAAKLRAKENSGGTPSSLDAWMAGKLSGADAALPLPRRVETAQLAALRRLLRYLSGYSPFYARRLAGHNPDLADLDDMARLPCTDSTHLREWRDFLCVSQGDIQRMVSLRTSGTSGSPKRLAFTEKDLAATRDFFRVGLSELTSPGERLAVLLPGAERPDGVADQIRQALSSLDIRVESPAHARIAGEQDTPESLADWVGQGKFHCLVAAPMQLRTLLHFFPQAPPPLRSVLAGADSLDPGLGLTLRAAWACDLRDHYGLTESGYGLAVECAAHDGYHMRALDIFTEILDVESDAPLPPGCPGEVVITTLGREAMPLLRYRTGDLSSLLPGPCRCGSPMPRLGPIMGRIERSPGQPPRLTRPPKGARSGAMEDL